MFEPSQHPLPPRLTLKVAEAWAQAEARGAWYLWAATGRVKASRKPSVTTFQMLGEEGEAAGE